MCVCLLFSRPFASFAPFGSSEFLRSLGVDGHGPIHTASEAFLQQEFCDVSVLQRKETMKVPASLDADVSAKRGVTVSYRMEDGAQYDLVGAALQDDLHVSLQKSGLCEELGLCCKRLR